MENFLALPAHIVLALMVIDLEPVCRWSDGRWRTVGRSCPMDGLAESDLEEMAQNRLVELSSAAAIITEYGRKVLREASSPIGMAGIAAKLSERDTHLSIQ